MDIAVLSGPFDSDNLGLYNIDVRIPVSDFKLLTVIYRSLDCSCFLFFWVETTRSVDVDKRVDRRL